MWISVLELKELIKEHDLHESNLVSTPQKGVLGEYKGKSPYYPLHFGKILYRHILKTIVIFFNETFSVIFLNMVFSR